MKQYAGLDVSLREVSICVVYHDGDVVHRASVPTNLDAIAQYFAEKGLVLDRIVHESGSLSIWLQRGLARLGLPAVCIDARLAHKALSARLNKSDAADAEGLAQLARTGWFTPVHVRSEDSDRLRTLLAARERLIRLRIDLEGHIRGILKTFGSAWLGSRKANVDNRSGTSLPPPVLAEDQSSDPRTSGRLPTCSAHLASSGFGNNS